MLNKKKKKRIDYNFPLDWITCLIKKKIDKN